MFYHRPVNKKLDELVHVAACHYNLQLNTFIFYLAINFFKLSLHQVINLSLETHFLMCLIMVYNMYFLLTSDFQLPAAAFAETEKSIFIVSYQEACSMMLHRVYLQITH